MNYVGNAFFNASSVALTLFYVHLHSRGFNPLSPVSLSIQQKLSTYAGNVRRHIELAKHWCE